MTVQTYTVNLEGNMAANANADAAAVTSLEEKLGALAKATGGVGESVNGLSEKLEGVAPHAESARDSSEGFLAALGEFELAKKGLEIVTEGILEAGKFAFEASEHVEQMSRSFAALEGTSEAGGKAALDQVRAIADQLPESSDQVEKWAQGLMAVGQTDMGKLNNSLHAIAGAEAMVSGSGEKVNSILTKLNSTAEKGTKVKFNVAQLEGTGVTEQEFLAQLGMSPAQLERAKKTATLSGGQIADALTGALNAKSKGALESQMNSLSTVFAKGRDMVARLSEGIDFGPIGEQLRSLFTVFDQAFPSGDAMKKGIGGALQGIINYVATLIPLARHLFLEMILYALQAYNFVRPLAAEFLHFLGMITSLDAFTDGLKTLALGIAVIIGAFIALGAAAVAAVALIVAGLGYVEKAAEAVGNWLGDAVFAIVQFVSKAAGFASDFVAGFVKGITDGIAAVTGAVENMGKSALSGIKGVLGIHSPSKAMGEVADDASAGFVKNMNAANDNVASAAGKMGTAAFVATKEGAKGKGASGGRDAGAAGGNRGGGSSSAVTQNNTFVAQIAGGVDRDTAREAVDIFEEEWASMTERMALSRGVAA